MIFRGLDNGDTRARSRRGARSPRLPVVADDPGLGPATARERRVGHPELRARRARGRLDRRERCAESVGLDRRLRPRPAEGGALLRPLRQLEGTHATGCAAPVGREGAGDREAEPAHLPAGRRPRRREARRLSRNRPRHCRRPREQGPGLDHRLPRPAACARRRGGQPPGGVPRGAAVVRQESGGALPPRLEPCAPGPTNRSSTSSLRLPDLARRLGLRRAALAGRVHLVAEVVARRRREHDSQELQPVPLGQQGGDDVDIWTVLSRRYYGQYDAPREKLAAIRAVRRAGKTVWSTTYDGISGSPRYTLTEPLSNPRMFLLWNALEDIPGTL
jgi:hypothetical protein